jgi:hypothetical protein
LHKCKVILYFPRNQPTKTMQVFRPTNHDETVSNITADIIEAIAYSAEIGDDVIKGAYESSDDQSAIIIAKNGRRFKVQLWEIL